MSLQLLQLVQLSICCFATYCVFTNSYLDLCSYIVGCVCSIDIILDIMNIKKLKIDMFLHHVFAIGIVCFSFMYNNDHYERLNLIRNELMAEISSIFLILMKLVPRRILLNYCIRILFLITFIYTRLYNYPKNIIFSTSVNRFIFSVTRNNFDLFFVYLCIYGLYMTNIYWTYLIVQKLFVKK